MAELRDEVLAAQLRGSTFNCRALSHQPFTTKLASGRPRRDSIAEPLV